jgi:hypothetical protein
MIHLETIRHTTCRPQASTPIMATFFLAILATGCAAPSASEGGEEQTGRANEAFSAYWAYAWDATSPSSVGMGTSSDRTCFLTGVVGSLKSLSPNFLEFVGATNGGTSWNLSVHPDGNDLGGYAACANSTSGRTQAVSWQTGQPAAVLGAITQHRSCFLNSVSTIRTGANDNGFHDPTDNVMVTYDGTNWLLSGSQTGTTIAQASCFDVTQGLGSWSYGGGSDPGKVALASNKNGDVSCYLTGIAGDFDTGDWSDGVYITLEQGQFYMNTSPGKSGSATCVR